MGDVKQQPKRDARDESPTPAHQDQGANRDDQVRTKHQRKTADDTTEEQPPPGGHHPKAQHSKGKSPEPGIGDGPTASSHHDGDETACDACPQPRSAADEKERDNEQESVEKSNNT